MQPLGALETGFYETFYAGIPLLHATLASFFRVIAGSPGLLTHVGLSHPLALITLGRRQV